MLDSHYKGYWMVTNRCNLRCSYCVLENSPDQLRRELDLDNKKEFLSHLYEKLGFRRLTLSGGEVTIIGKRAPADFIELLRHARRYRSDDPIDNLEMEMYTNGAFVTETVANEMEGTIDTVAVTIDSANDDFLTQIGRSHRGKEKYLTHITQVCRYLTERGIELKLHSVVSQKNLSFLSEEVPVILDAVEKAGGDVAAWKFYQYMSYDDPIRDVAHAIPNETYEEFTTKTRQKLEGHPIRLHFKDNGEMNASLFNILSYGNAQYMKAGDSWSTSRRTEDLRSYNTMAELFSRCEIDEARFRQFHEIKR